VTKQIAVRDSDKVRQLTPLCAAALMLLGLAAPATAADPSWVSSHVRGTVIYLAGDKWEEIVQGQSLVTASVRTLRSGELSLETGGVELRLGPSSVLELGSSPEHPGSQLRHYIGTMTISSTGPVKVFLQAGRLSLTSIEGEAELAVNEASTVLSVHTGTVSVRDPGGNLTSLLPGDYITTGSGIVVATAANATKEPKAATAGTVLAGVMAAQSAGPDAAGSGANGGPGNNNGNAGGSNGAANSGNPNAGSGNNSNAGAGKNSNAGGSNGAANSGNPNAGSGNNSNAGAGNNNAGGNTSPGGNPNGGGNGPTANNAGGNGNGQANGHATGNANGDDDTQSGADVSGVVP